MFSYVDGNIFETPAQTLVNTVNTTGAMGKGLAKEFKRLFPEMFKEYQILCESGKFKTGQLWLYKTPNKWVLNFPTKTHWRLPSKIEYIEKGLKAFSEYYKRVRITSIAFPRLGCGNGELNWSDVKPLIEKYLKNLPIDVYIYEKGQSFIPEHKQIKEMRKWLQSQPQEYPFIEFKQDIINTIEPNSMQTDIEGISFNVKYTTNDIIIKQNEKHSYISWEGNDLSNGMLQLWQLFRAKGVCTKKDLNQMGFELPNCILSLLKQLKYIIELKLIGSDDNIAIKLDSTPDDLDLFKYSSSYNSMEI